MNSSAFELLILPTCKAVALGLVWGSFTLMLLTMLDLAIARFVGWILARVERPRSAGKAPTRSRPVPELVGRPRPVPDPRWSSHPGDLRRI